ncbi:hypothetical protein E0L36_11180 [Streptomyces sp. AJS327]|nr:hypothetical protein [Streptomyces sp. AJS327]
MCLGLTALLTGCGQEEDPDEGTNGLGKLSPAKAEMKARKAAESASAVRLTGNVESKGGTHRLEMRLTGNGGMGQVSTKGGGTFELLRVGQDLYLKAGGDFWARQAKSGAKPTEADLRAAGKLDGKYVKVPRGDPAYKQLRGFTDKRVLLDGLLAMDGKRAADERGEVGGLETLRVTAGEGASGGSVHVSLNGTPYPLQVERAGGRGKVELTDWNKKFTLRAPKKEHTVDYGKQITAD